MAIWVDAISVAGLAVSILGVGAAALAARRAGSASDAAKTAANQIAQRLQAADLQRIIERINHIKTLHGIDRWEVASEQYQLIRAMLSDVIARCPKEQEEISSKLTNAREALLKMEDAVRGRSGVRFTSRTKNAYGRQLNAIQSDLETLSSVVGIDISEERQDE